MEKEGLVRAIEFLKSHGLQIGTIITDRHRQIAKYIRESLPGTIHLFDVWHVAKGKYLKCIHCIMYKHTFCECFPEQFQFKKLKPGKLREVMDFNKFGQILDTYMYIAGKIFWNVPVFHLHVFIWNEKVCIFKSLIKRLQL